MGAIVIKTDKKKTHLISKLARELGGNVISIDEEQYEDFLLGKIMDESKTGEMVDFETVMKELRNEHWVWQIIFERY